jgi:methionine-rich copper-binding protein CopC
MTRRRRRFLSASSAGAALLAALSMAATMVVAMWPEPAGAHPSTLVSAEPTPDARVGRLPTQVQLRFRRPPVPDPRTKVAMVSPSGENLAQGKPAVTGLGVSQRVSPAHEIGVYVVSYSVVAVDGHLSRGSYQFLLTAAATSRHDALSIWWWALIGVGFVGLVVGGSVALQSQLRRSGSGQPHPVPTARDGS